MAYDAKKIYYRFDDHLSRLVLDYEASRQISSESENLYHCLLYTSVALVVHTVVTLELGYVSIAGAVPTRCIADYFWA